MKEELSKTQLDEVKFDDKIVKMFLFASLAFGAVGMLLGVLLATQIVNWQFNFLSEYLTFGRIRALHTNAVIFAFVGNGMFAGVYYSLQRLCRARLFSDTLSKIHFWGWQLIIVLAVVTLPLGLSQAKEYAELIWPIDILIALIWVVFAINFFGTLYRRREKHIYVAIWFYIATIITVALLHIVNSLQLPVDLISSYPIYAGVQDALVQWWYGHNAVAFFLTTPMLGIMYYFVPKAVNRPVYSYRLSIIHFWSLIFIYIWAGPHHLLYTALPDWVQTLGMIFSLMLWAPSWGGMINGLLTLRGAWDRVRREPILKFYVAALTFYGMSTFEGPLLSIKSISSLGHYTDWIVGHVHSGGIGWNYFLFAGMMYYLIPKLWNTTIYSTKLGNTQFWTGIAGILLYYVSMTVAGITQGLMWKAVDENGQLMYPNFMETVDKILPLHGVRLVGGILVFISFLIMLYNFYKTIKGAKKYEEPTYLIPKASWKNQNDSSETGHRKLEGMTALFTVLATIAVLVGTAIEFLPAFLSNQFIPISSKIKPYTPLEVLGRDLYLREGCYNCHSQMIRPLVDEALRYGDASEATEFIYDRPFQWGSKRTGPDLQRVGGKYPHSWHYRHMMDPREVVPGSIMPAYPWLEKKQTAYQMLGKKMSTLKALGVPYSEEEMKQAERLARAQAQEIMRSLELDGINPKYQDREIIALIAYLQRLGMDIKKSE
jgi:cytochrome c oxidase cbb3-type subunit I/II